MTSTRCVLVLGGTGRTGQRVVSQLLGRGVSVRAIVRSARRLPPGMVGHPLLEVIEADLMSLGTQDLMRHARDCDAVVSCLGHTISVRGILGPPRDLVTRATTRVCRAIEALQPAAPVKVIVQLSVSVNHPAGLDSSRGVAERAILWVLRMLIPPAKDNQHTASFLFHSIGPANPYVEWVAIRPDTLMDGEVTDYALHERLVSSIFEPDSTNMSNVAHFMCELVTNPATWVAWKGTLPVVINAAAARG